MKKLFGLLAAAVLCLAACNGCARMARPDPALSPKPVSKTYHVDKDFTADQYGIIAGAGAVWVKQANGWLKLTFVHDLDTTNEADSLDKCDEGCIVKSYSMADFVKESDEQLGATMLGVVVNRGSMMILVADRLEHPQDLYEVAMHELGHTFGMKHTRDEKSLMYPAHRSYAGIQCPNVSDMSEFCRSTGCDLRSVDWCN